MLTINETLDKQNKMLEWTTKRTISTPLLLLGITELLVLYSSIYVGAVILYGSIEAGEYELGALTVSAASIAIVMLAALVSMGLYNFHQRIYFREVLVRVATAIGLGSIVLAAVFYLMPSVAISSGLIVVAVIYVLVLLLAARYIFMHRVDENMFRHRTLVYGAGRRASAIADLRRKADRRGFRIVGSVPAPGDSQVVENGDRLFHGGDIDQLAEELDADEIVIAMDDRRGNLPIRKLLNCKLRGIKVIDLVEFFERESGKIRIDLVNPGWLIFSYGFQIRRIHRFIKRMTDLVASLVILLLTWPIMLVIAIAIKMEDGVTAPVLYRQTRVGYRGEVFDTLKFRSMREDAEADGQAVWAEENDERVTRVGKYLRKFHLDELPQTFNVIRGQMSIVGPRPERPAFVEQLSVSIPYYAERHSVKPGVTGWAQLRYAYGSSEEDALEKLQYDLYYVKNHTFLLDALIMLQTVEVVLWGNGAR